MNSINVNHSVEVQQKSFYISINCYRNFKRVFLAIAFPKSVTEIVQKLLNLFFFIF